MTQRLLAVNAGTLAISDPEGSTDLVLLPPPWPPDEAAEPPTHQPPKLIQAPTDVIGEANNRPPDFPDPQMQGTTAWELEPPVSACIRRGSPFLTRVPMHALICGPARMSPSPTRLLD